MTIQMPCERKRYEYPNAWWKERVWLSGCQVEGNSMTIQMLSEKKQGTVWISKCLVKWLWLSVCQMKDMAIRKPGGRKHYGYRDARWKETVWLSVCHGEGGKTRWQTDRQTAQNNPVQAHCVKLYVHICNAWKRLKTSQDGKTNTLHAKNISGGKK